MKRITVLNHQELLAEEFRKRIFQIRTPPTGRHHIEYYQGARLSEYCTIHGTTSFTIAEEGLLSLFSYSRADLRTEQLPCVEVRLKYPVKGSDGVYILEDVTVCTVMVFKIAAGEEVAYWNPTTSEWIRGRWLSSQF